VRRLTDTPSAEYAPSWSPDGRSVAYLGTQRPLTSSETTMEDTHVWLRDADGSHPVERGGVLDQRQDDLRWSPDGQALLAAVEERGSIRLRRFPRSGPSEVVVPPAAEPGLVRSWSMARDGTLAYTLATPGGPAELWLKDAAGVRRATSLNETLLAQRALAPVESFTFRSADDVEIQAFLTKPHGLQNGSRHPLVVWLHGGPHAQQGPAFDLRAQVHATQGWATLMVNYRGSTGYGQKVADAIFKDQDGGEARDVLAAVDAALARYPWLDGGRLAVGGVSYGGQLTNWLITQSDRFRAAAPLAGISNLVSFNYMAYYHDYLAVEFGAYPHEGGLLDVLWQRSPLRYVAKVRTPVLFLHGENDNDVPIAEAEQFFIALQDVGVETQMVRYPREGHGLREAGHVVDALDRTVAWFRAHFQ
jgi:dipeptidyl aminopeptidase/acylaminoacyl peptidase